MKRNLYTFRLYVIIPIIFAGIAILSVIVGYRTSLHVLHQGGDPAPRVLFWIAILGGGAFLSGLLITRTLLRPIEKFVGEAVNLGFAQGLKSEPRAQNRPVDEMEPYTRVFREVRNVLSRVQAKELFPEIIGQSQAMRRILTQIRKVAPTDATVLITGESGTGKELVANTIQSRSLRRDRRFVKLNCAAIPAGLLESELFGHEKGAFTGADSRKQGKFEQASGGTIFLDEIGDMPLDTQAKILRVLEEREVDRVGGSRPIPVDVRVLAASNQDLEAMVEKGEFREDLFFRLNVFPIRLPSLGQRPDDIPFLVDVFIKNSGKAAAVSPDAMRALQAHNWQGNVRELRNAIESALVFDEKVIDIDHLPGNILPGRNFLKFEAAPPVEANGDQDLDAHLQVFEKALIEEALKKAGGVQVKAARYLGIKDRSLWHRVKKLGIDPSKFKGRDD